MSHELSQRAQNTLPEFLIFVIDITIDSLPGRLEKITNEARGRGWNPDQLKICFLFCFVQFRFREYCVILGINWGHSLLVSWILWKIWEVTTTQPNVFVANISFLQNVIACNHKIFMKKTIVYFFIKNIWSFGCMFWNTSFAVGCMHVYMLLYVGYMFAFLQFKKVFLVRLHSAFWRTWSW